MKYINKPIEIEAIQYTGDNEQEIRDFIKSGDSDEVTVKINTPEGKMVVSVGDYVVKGVKGEFYLCKPDIFEEKYVPIEIVKIIPDTQCPKCHKPLKENIYRMPGGMVRYFIGCNDCDLDVRFMDFPEDELTDLHRERCIKRAIEYLRADNPELQRMLK